MPRRKNKRGRPRHAGPREPNGRKQRVRDMDSVAINARQRVFGLSEAQARDQHAETVLGRLWLRGVISEHQREAGYRYREKYLSMKRAIEPPRGFEVSGRSGSPPDWDAPDFDRLAYTDQAIRAIADYEALKVAIGQCAPIVELVVLRDCELDTKLAMRKLTDGLDILVKQLGIVALDKASRT